MKLDLHYVDPRLVDLYDTANGRGPDTEFYLDLASELGAQTISDLGCGTGILTRALAIHARTVTGVDPARAMLEYAQRQSGADRVRWIEGDSGALPPHNDLVLMTGNVAQVFLEDEEWERTLRNLHGALRTGGSLAFETRNPIAREWESWTREATFQTTQTAEGPLDEWLENVTATNGRVSLEGHNVFRTTGEELVVRSELRFRTQEEVTLSLERNDFVVDGIYGNWSRGPVAADSRVLVFVAHTRSQVSSY